MTTMLTNSPADLLAYQRDLVRTGKCFPLGRIKMISIAPNAKCPPLPTWDVMMKERGRLIQLRDRMLPIAQSPDRKQILITAPFPVEGGVAVLPDLPDPTWTPGALSREEIEGKVQRDPAKIMPRMMHQSLRDRAEGFLEGTNFYVFSPVLSIAFQPEIENRLQATFWAVDCRTNPVDGSSPTLLIDAKTGEAHFLHGLYDIVTARGEN